MRSEIFMKIGVLMAYIIMVTTNALANILPINNLTTGAISDLYPNLFTPAGVTFSIWGIIYILLLGFVVVQFGFRQKILMKHDGMLDNSKHQLMALRIAFIVSSLLNTLWILCWHYQKIGLSLLIMIALLICLIVAYKIQMRFRNHFFLKVPFSVYLGWISVATIANTAVWLTSIGWSGFGVSDLVWTLIVILAAIGLGLIYRRDLYYNLVIAWALLGIVLRHMDSSYEAIVWLSGIGLVVCLFVSVITVLKYRKVGA